MNELFPSFVCLFVGHMSGRVASHLEGREIGILAARRHCGHGVGHRLVRGVLSLERALHRERLLHLVHVLDLHLLGLGQRRLQRPEVPALDSFVIS